MEQSCYAGGFQGPEAQLPNGTAALVSLGDAPHCLVVSRYLCPLNRGCFFAGAMAMGRAGGGLLSAALSTPMLSYTPVPMLYLYTPGSPRVSCHFTAALLHLTVAVLWLQSCSFFIIICWSSPQTEGHRLRVLGDLEVIEC